MGSQNKYITDGRALGLDALRGFAILTMVLSGIIPYGELPAWMYHAQLPPPDHAFDPEVRGITWVDLVFPFFLFSMGVAIPLALKKRFEKGDPYSAMLKKVGERGLLLAFFAIYLQHIRPFVLEPSDKDAWVWWTALGGGALLFLIYTRLPKTWSRYTRWGIRIAGFAGAVALLSVLSYPDGTGFSLHRSDIILIVLTNMAIFTSLIWLATPERPDLRLGILVILAGLMLSAEEPGWVARFWDKSPIPWLFQFDYLKYLFILIPATIVGDRLLRGMKQNLPSSAEETKPHREMRYWMLSMSGIIITVVVLAGLLGRHVFPTVLVVAIIMAGSLWMIHNPRSKNESLFRNLAIWGAFWLMLGLVLEPFEGGIRKDHATFSYYFVTTGVSIWIMVSLMIWIDVFRGTRVFSLLIENGQNPMIAYAGMQNFVLPVLMLTGVHDLLLSVTEHHPWLGVLRAVGYTVLLAFLVGQLTRRGVFWRS